MTVTRVIAYNTSKTSKARLAPKETKAAYKDRLKFTSSPLETGLRLKLSLLRELMGLSPNYNNLGFGQVPDMVCLSLKAA